VSGRHEPRRWADIIAIGERFHAALASFDRPAFIDRRTPAIIDFSPYWRPAPYAAAIVVADALAGEGADETLLDAVAHIDDFAQYLLRALLFRAVADRLLGGDPTPLAAPVELACLLVASGI
jgi:hypothetical protein